jgi:hypothetical protein
MGRRDVGGGRRRELMATEVQRARNPAKKGVTRGQTGRGASPAHQETVEGPGRGEGGREGRIDGGGQSLSDGARARARVREKAARAGRVVAAG